MNAAPRPHRLVPNPVPIFYEGGPSIAEFRGIDSFLSPEDWVGSVSRFPNAEDDSIGLATTDSGETILDLITEDPQAWLGRDHRTDDTGILVKLLDAGVRLPVHWHPTRAFAREHLGCPYGKAEGWIILSPGRVWLGFKLEPSGDQLAEWLRTQDGDDMLANMNEVPVGYGDIVYVPPGTTHAIDQGVFLLELQEPTSFSFILEHEAFNMSSAEAALGIDWSDAMRSVRHVPGVVDESVVGGGLLSATGSLFPAAADEFFRANLLSPAIPRADLDSYTVAVVIEGRGTLTTPDAPDTEVVAGSTWAIPAAVGQLGLLNDDATVILCRPPNQLPEGPGAAVSP